MSVRLVLIGSDAPVEIDAYRGYGNGRRVLVQGRVTRAANVGKSTATDSVLRNLVNTYKRARAYPIPYARVEASLAGTRVEIAADAEGFFHGWLEVGGAEPLVGPWAEVSLAVVAPEAHRGARASARVRIPTASATLGVISDLDDTVIQSQVGNLMAAARTVITGNARTRLPFPGVAALYQALERGGDGARQNPVYYVSSSPWNLYDMIAEFLELQAIPEGPICLRDWDIGLDALSSTRLKGHKEPVIRAILDATGELPFILIGDTSQQDPEIYASIVASYPGRILAVYIRNVGANRERAAAVHRLAEEVLEDGSALVLADDSYAAGKHAAERGWIVPDALERIRAEKRVDEGTAGPSEG